MKDMCAFWNEYDSIAGHVCYCELAAFNRPVNPQFLMAVGCTPDKRKECLKSMELAIGAGVIPEELPALQPAPAPMSPPVLTCDPPQEIAKTVVGTAQKKTALAVMKKHRWPGNIRELSNTVAQALLLCKGVLIDVEDLPERIRKSTAEPDQILQGAAADKNSNGVLFSGIVEDGAGLNGLLESFQQVLFESIKIREGFDFDLFCRDINQWRDSLIAGIIEAALEDTYGNQVKAAKLLGITPRALRYHLQKARNNRK